jgi:hypothetical protein
MSPRTRYYACSKICSVWTTFDEKARVAGDMVVGPRRGMLALMARRGPGGAADRAERALRGPSRWPGGRSAGRPMARTSRTAGGLDVEGLARVKGELYGINTAGTVFRIVEPPPGESGGWKVEVHDELGPLFTAPDLSVRIRGATRVVIE